MLKKFKNNYPILIFFILSLIPFYWFRTSVYPAGGVDTGLVFSGYNPQYLLSISSSVWQNHSSLGLFFTGYANIAYLPLYFIFYLLSKIGLNAHFREILIFSSIMFTGMTFMYLFLLDLFEEVQWKKLIAIISPIFFIFNSYTLMEFWGLDFYIYLFAFLPVIFFVIHRGLKTFKKRYILYFALLTSSIFSFLGVYPQSTAPVFIALILFIIFYIILNFNTDYLKRIFIYLFVLIFIATLFNLWWIIPFSMSILKLYHNSNRHNFLLNETISRNALLNLLMFFNNIPRTGAFGIFKKILSYYNYPFIKIIDYLISFIIVIPFLFFTDIIKKKKIILYFFLLFITMIFFSVGLNKPFGSIFLIMLKDIPFFLIFNAAFADFGPVLIFSYSILFGLGIVILYNLLNLLLDKHNHKINNIFLVLILFIVYFLYAYPMLSGSIFSAPPSIPLDTKELKTSFVDIPHYYNRLSNFFRGDRLDYNTLSLPLLFTGHIASVRPFYWKYGEYRKKINFSLIYSHNTISNLNRIASPSDKIINTLQANEFNENIKILNLMSMKYIILQNDIYMSPYDKHVLLPFSEKYEPNYKYIPKSALPHLLIKGGLKFIKQFGKLDLYKVPNKYFINFVYTPTNLMFVSDNIGSFNNYAPKDDINYKLSSVVPYIIMLPNYKRRSVIFITMLNTKKKSFEINSIRKNLKTKETKTIIEGKVHRIETARLNNSLTIELKKINPTKYIVIVHNVKANFPLILNQNYSHYWNLYPEKYPSFSLPNKNLVDYQCKSILYDDCMSIKNLVVNIKRGNISYTGDKFISKDFNGTIQNDNAPSGHILQTLFQTPYPHKYHFIANGYANSWWININDIKKLGRQYYKVNKDGTYDFEFIIDFWPQRLFYVGLLISGTTTIVFILYLIFDYNRKRHDGKR